MAGDALKISSKVISHFQSKGISMHFQLPLIALIAITFICQCAHGQNIGSQYTHLSGPSCKKRINDKATGAFTLKCPGLAGYNLNIMEDDERTSIDVIAPE